MENVKNIELVEHIAKGLAKFHGEPNLKFYKELCEELFVQYAEFEDYAAGATRYTHLIKRSFQKAQEEKAFESELED